MNLPTHINEQGQMVWPDHARDLPGLQAQAAGETFVLDVQAGDAPDDAFEAALRDTAGRSGALFKRLADA